MSLLKKTGKIFVTGAQGQLGTDVASALTAGGFQTVCFGRNDLDITDKEAVFSVTEKEAPRIIINCAAYTKVDLAEEEHEKAFAVNHEGAANLALACEAGGAALIHISTDFVFDGAKTTPYTEEDKTGPLGIYGKSKLAGEEAIRETCPRHIIIRTSWLYGIHGNNFVKTIVRLASEKEVLRVVSDQIGTPTWTVDLAHVITKMAEATGEANAPPLFGLYHYSNEGLASWYDFALAIVEEARGLDMKLKCGAVEPIPTSAYPTPAARPSYSAFDKEKIKKKLSLDIPHWRTSLIGMLKELSEERGQRDG